MRLAWRLVLPPTLLVALLLAVASPARALTAWPPAPALPLGADVLTPQEQAFLATLPEVRVVVPLPAARPYEIWGEDGTLTGIHPEMLSHLARAFGLRLRPLPVQGWTAALQALERREADLIMSIGYTTERERYLAFTLGVTPLPGALFTRSQRAPSGAADEAELAHGRFALERNFLAVDHVRRQYPQAQILSVETTGDALRAVAEGRADHYLGSLLEVVDWLARQPVPGVELNRLLPYGGGHYHFAVRKDWAPLAGILNKGLTALRAQGLDAAGSAAWAAATATLPQGLRLPAPVTLQPDELALLSQRPVWRIGAVRGLPLLNHIEPDGRHTGLAAEVSEQVARRLGVGMQIKPYDSTGQMLDALRQGDIDLVPMLTRTDERAAEFVFSAPYGAMPHVIVARSDAPLYWGLASLRGRTLALAAQHPLRPLLTSRYADIRLLEVTDGRAALQAVADGLADAAVEVKLLANLHINSGEFGALRTVATADEVPPQFHFAARPGEQGLLRLVDRALADIPADEHLRMHRRWVAVDLAPPDLWQRWRVPLAVAAGLLLLVALATAWWVRRLSREVARRRRIEAQLRDIGATLPCVAFRHVFAAGQNPATSPLPAPHNGWVSPRVEHDLGLVIEPGQTLLKQLARRLPSREAAALVDHEQDCLASGQRLHHTVVYPHPDGSVRRLLCEAVRSEDAQGRVAWTGYIVDTSAAHRLQQQLVDAAQSRNLLLASASHELRAPAHTLLLALQTLPDDGLAAEHQRALRIARDAADTLTQLLGDVLDAARFDGAPLRLHPQDFDLHELLHKVAEGAAAGADSKGLRFEHRLAAQLPRHVHQDPLRLRQIVVNLLSNALKYTAAGRIDLDARLRERSNGGPAELLITVADTGPGIAIELQERLFKPFAVVAGVAAGSQEGSSGLGLAISRQLAERLGGRLELSSRPGAGTRVTLHLPFSAARDTPAATPRNGVLLVCDDDPTSRLLLAHLLRARGFEVEETESAEDALQRCRQGGIAALVTDLEMPGLGGLGLLQALHDGAAGMPQRPLCIVCSGAVEPAAGGGSSHPLADAALAKPVDLQQLTATLARLGLAPAQAPRVSSSAPAGEAHAQSLQDLSDA